VVLVQDKRMKEAWCLATNRSDLKAAEIAKLYGKRFTIEETFRDTKDVHFGMGLKATHIGDSSRRDRLLLLGAMAQALLALLGDAGERAGMDRVLKVNTSKARQHSLYDQGSFWYDALPNMR
jgi:Transposase DDE domain